LRANLAGRDCRVYSTDLRLLVSGKAISADQHRDILTGLLQRDNVLPRTPHVKNNHQITLDGEQNSVHACLVAVKQLANFERECHAFGCKGSSRGKISQRVDRFLQAYKPAKACFAGTLSKQPHENFI
jgi:hypothetical protein